MSVIKISELVEVIELNSTDTFPVVSEGETRKANVQQVFNYVNVSQQTGAIYNKVAPYSYKEIRKKFPNENIIYLVPSSNDEGNLYDEYMYIDDKPEKIGAQTVDLSGYSTTNEVQEMINNSIGGALDGSY